MFQRQNHRPPTVKLWLLPSANSLTQCRPPQCLEITAKWYLEYSSSFWRTCVYTNHVNHTFIYITSQIHVSQGLYCDIRQLVQFIKEAHGNVFRRVALSALLDSAEKVTTTKKPEEKEEGKQTGPKRYWPVSGPLDGLKLMKSLCFPFGLTLPALVWNRKEFVPAVRTLRVYCRSFNLHLGSLME